MFAKILVPLDGGEFADGVLAVVSRFLSQGSRVELFTVYSGASEREEAVAHLEKKGRELQASGATVSHALQPGDPAAGILERVEAAKPDLVAMASHGRRGPWLWVRGSVAERVLRNCPAPLLIAHPSGAGEPPPTFRRILVPLDGSDRALAILPLAVSLARAFSAEVVLFRASNAHHLTLEEFVTPPESRGPIPSAEQLEASLAPAAKLVSEGGVAVRSLAALGDPAAQILQVADEEGIDLIALTTHGRTGLRRWLFGSVAEKVLRAWRRPVLVLRDRHAAADQEDPEKTA